MKPSFEKYIPFKQINLPDRQWPNNTITKAPIWCSVDLRDGNQALVDPMNLEEKLEFFHALCDMGFKEIEIGFPSASETEYEICRELIENNHIPDDVTIMWTDDNYGYVRQNADGAERARAGKTGIYYHISYY